MKLSDFELTHLLDAPRRYVPCFYGTNQDYLRLKSRPPPISYAGVFEAEALVSLLSDTDASVADDRRHALELQIEEPLPFRSPLVRALILPRDIKSAPFLSSFLSGPGRDIEVRWFDLAPLRVAKDYQLLIEAQALRIQEAGGCYEV